MFVSTLSLVRTIMGMAQDIFAAVETAIRNRSRCDKVAERVRCLINILEAAAVADDDATRTVLDRLEKALRRALEVVRRCQRPCSFLRAASVVVIGGRAAADDPLERVEAEIDRCILDLNLAKSIRIARLLEYGRCYSLPLPQLVPPPSYGGYYCYGGYGCWDDDEARAGGAPPPSDDAAPAFYLYHTQHSRYPPSMFSDEDPNSCSIM